MDKANLGSARAQPKDTPPLPRTPGFCALGLNEVLIGLLSWNPGVLYELENPCRITSPTISAVDFFGSGGREGAEETAKAKASVEMIKESCIFLVQGLDFWVASFQLMDRRRREWSVDRGLLYFFRRRMSHVAPRLRHANMHKRPWTQSSRNAILPLLGVEAESIGRLVSPMPSFGHCREILRCYFCADANRAFGLDKFKWLDFSSFTIA